MNQKNIMLVCSNMHAKLYPLKIDKENLYDTVKNIIGDNFESVSVKKLHDIIPNAVFLCSEDFRNLKNNNVNIYGTYLYDDNYEILGTICILKYVYTADGYDLDGLTDKEARYLQDVLTHNVLLPYKEGYL